MYPDLFKLRNESFQISFKLFSITFVAIYILIKMIHKRIAITYISGYVWYKMINVKSIFFKISFDNLRVSLFIGC